MKAKYKEKMIEINVRLWTNDLAPERDHINPRHARTSGVVRFARNDSHGLKSDGAIPFNSFSELETVIRRLAAEHDVTLHASRGEARELR